MAQWAKDVKNGRNGLHGHGRSADWSLGSSHSISYAEIASNGALALIVAALGLAGQTEELAGSRTNRGAIRNPVRHTDADSRWLERKA